MAPNTPLPRVGEVWGIPSKPMHWRRVTFVGPTWVRFDWFGSESDHPDTLASWQSWSRDKQLIQPREEAK